MEFKYRAGEAPPPPLPPPPPPPPLESYFSSFHSIRGGFYGSGRDGFRVDVLRAPVSTPEAMRRQLEKERMREEILAREDTWRREIEEEVRQELAMEQELSMQREIALRRQAERFSLASSSFRHPPRSSSSLEITPVSSQQNVSVVEDVSADKQISRPGLEVGDGSEDLLGKSSKNNILAGTKRKVAVDNQQLESQKKIQKDWSCALCGVKTTGSKALEEHFGGRKHKAKQGRLRTFLNAAKCLEVSVAGPENETEKGKFGSGQDTTVESKMKHRGVNGAEAEKTGKLCSGPNTNTMIEIEEQHCVNGAEAEKNAGKFCNGPVMNTTLGSIEKNERVNMAEAERGGKYCNGPDTNTTMESNEKHEGVNGARAEKASEFWNGPDTNTTVAIKEKHQGVNGAKAEKKAGFTFRCDHCGIKCYNEAVMIAHLKGKEHAAQVEKLVGENESTMGIEVIAMKDQKLENVEVSAEEMGLGDSFGAEILEKPALEGSWVVEGVVAEEPEEVLRVKEEATTFAEEVKDNIQEKADSS